MSFSIGAQNYYTSTQSDTWFATDDLERQTKKSEEYGPVRENRVVGIFYFIWMGAHGYDRHTDNPNGQIFKPSKKDVNSPYDISELLRQNPKNPQYGPEHAFHYWGKPHFDYYVSNDEWVIEKHIQMLADAGIDVMILDNTNTQIYLPQWLAICKVMTRMREQGRTTPQLASIISTKHVETLQDLYDRFYAKGLYQDLWFYWKGKPLVMCQTEGISEECRDFFTIRRTWFDSKEKWYTENPKGKWTWGDYYPQTYGWNESPDIPEQLSVSSATHPTSNIGRSYHNGKQPSPSKVKSGEGAFFAEQWERVFEVDPEFVFITGWNEWVAMRFIDGSAANMLGKPIKKGDTHFVDQFNEEFSRDLEPMRGGFGDNYYYQMVDMIRKYKGVNPPPVEMKQYSINIDGNIQDWKSVDIAYYDDKGDIIPRDHFGWGNVGRLTNDTGRNDITISKVASDEKNLYFYMEANDKIQVTQESPLFLFISADTKNKGWEGFEYMVEISEKDAPLFASKKGWNWEKKSSVLFSLKGKYVELAIPLALLDIKNAKDFSLNFKWADNIPRSGDIKDFMDHGDTAPNNRFRYQYQIKLK